MPEKTSETGQPYAINGKTFTWTTDEGETVTIPMRLKLGVIRRMADRDLDAAAMFEIVDTIAPGQEAVLDEQDVNDFTAMFRTWQEEYTALQGATPGE